MGSSSSTSFDPDRDISDLHGKVIIVTGGNTGIGYETVRHLARKGAKIYIAARNESKANAAIEKLKQENITGEIKYLHLDLNDCRITKKSPETFIEQESRLDVLINNASVLSDHGKPTLNLNGIQENMATNYLGTVLFTQTLLPLLKSTASLPGSDVRIVNLGSRSHKRSPSTTFNSREAWNQQFSSSLTPTWWLRYAYSKLALHLWSNQLANRLREENINILVILINPGVVLSDGSIGIFRRLVPFLTNFVLRLLRPLFRTPVRGAYPSVFAAASPKCSREVYHGKCIDPKNGFFEQSAVALDEAKQKELWEFTETVIKELGE